MSTPATSAARIRHAGGVALALLTLAVYAVTLTSGWLEYDDDWLVRDNPFFTAPTLEGLARIWVDLSRETRLALGAEYLPVRDTSEWLAAISLGVGPTSHHAIDVALYLAACFALRSWLHRALPERALVVEVCVLLFATHPVHVESVAWIAGRKDVLALLFSALALRAYASDDPRARRVLAPLAIALACLAKATSVVLPLLLVAHDLLRPRAPDRAALALSLVPALGALALHLRVGATVGMLASLPGGSRAAALMTMAPVLFRYLGLSVGALPSSIAHDVPERSLADPIAWLALGGAALAIAGCALAWRRGARVPAIALAWMLVALAPVSQVAAPLQNRMADRYLLLAVLGPLLSIAAAIDHAPPRLRASIAALAIAACTALGALRALTFAEPITLWVEAAALAPADTVGPYQLAMATRDHDPARAEAAFREAMRRDGLRTEDGRRALNNLAILLADQGRLDEAIALLELALPRYRDDPRIRRNLATLYEAVGATERAAALRAELAARFAEE